MNRFTNILFVFSNKPDPSWQCWIPSQRNSFGKHSPDLEHVNSVSSQDDPCEFFMSINDKNMTESNLEGRPYSDDIVLFLSGSKT